MRYAIISDIHGNLAALEAVVKDMENRGGFDKIWCLGDIVGYGPDPGKCIELLRRYDHICVAGNHDWASVDRISTIDFNHDAAEANHWTGQQLTESDKQYINGLGQRYEEVDFTMVHGSPREPIWEYLFSSSLAQENFKEFQTQCCLVGHSHLPLVFEEVDGDIKLNSFSDGAELQLGSARLIVNPGSVGQPRDSDPRASYAMYDSDRGRIYHYRVDYDFKATQIRMADEGLPAFLIERLSHGW